MKNARSTLGALAILTALSSCVTTDVTVVDYKTKAPIESAAVTAVNGNYSSAPVYTDASGYAEAPTLPMGEKQLVVKKKGYQTGYVKLSP